jgi:hypothetical protein
MQERKSFAAPVEIGLLIALPILYVLSFGPAMWMYDHDFASEPVLRVIYYPILSIWKVPWFHDYLAPYVQLWRPTPPLPAP